MVPTEGWTIRKTVPWQRTRMLSPNVISEGMMRVISTTSPWASGKSVKKNAPRVLRSCVKPEDSCCEPDSLTDTGTFKANRCPQRRSRQSGVVMASSGRSKEVPGTGKARTENKLYRRSKQLGSNVLSEAVRVYKYLWIRAAARQFR